MWRYVLFLVGMVKATGSECNVLSNVVFWFISPFSQSRVFSNLLSSLTRLVRTVLYEISQAQMELLYSNRTPKIPGLKKITFFHLIEIVKKNKAKKSSQTG